MMLQAKGDTECSGGRCVTQSLVMIERPVLVLCLGAIRQGFSNIIPILVGWKLRWGGDTHLISRRIGNAPTPDSKHKCEPYIFLFFILHIFIKHQLCAGPLFSTLRIGKAAEGAELGGKTRSSGLDIWSMRSLLDAQAGGYTSLRGEVRVEGTILRTSNIVGV